MSTAFIRQNRWNNLVQTAILVLAMTCLNLLVGWLLLGQIGFWIAVAMTVIGVGLAQGICPTIVLRMFHAQPIQRAMAPELWDTFIALLQKAAISRPVSLYYIPSRVPNAFAVGNRTKVAVAVSDGLLRLLSPRELAGVLAHEIAHIRNEDLRVMVTADALGRVVASFSRIGLILLLLGLPALLAGNLSGSFVIAGLVMFFAPSVSMMLQLALSRRREFNADLGAAELTGDPRGLALALERLERLPHGGWLRRVLIPDQGKSPPAWLRTHPPTPERIEHLLEIERSLAGSHEHPAASRMFESKDPLAQPERSIPGHSRHYVVHAQPRVRTRPRWHAGSGMWY